MKPTTLIAASLSIVMLGACSPTPLTDEQVKMFIAECAKHGYATHLFNSPVVSRADCVEVKHAGP